jgi:hypothetical protein
LVFANESSGQLVQVIPAPVTDRCIDAGDPQTGLGAVVGPLLPAAQSSLGPGEACAVLPT